MPVYKIECIVHRRVSHYITAETEEEAIEFLNDWDDIDKVIKVELHH